MNVLSALIFSEDFQGIVSSEAGSKRYEDESSMSPVPSKTGENSKSQPEDSGNGRISGLEVKNVNSDRRSADDGGISRLSYNYFASIVAWSKTIKLPNFRVSIVVVRCNYFSIGARFYQYGQLKYLQPVTWCCVDHQRLLLPK